MLIKLTGFKSRTLVTGLLGLALSPLIWAQSQTFSTFDPQAAIATQPTDGTKTATIAIPVITPNQLESALDFYKKTYPSLYNNRKIKVIFLFNTNAKNLYTGEELKGIIETTIKFPNILFLNDISVKLLGADPTPNSDPQTIDILNQIHKFPYTAINPTITFSGKAKFTASDMMKIIMALARAPIANIILPKLTD